MALHNALYRAVHTCGLKLQEFCHQKYLESISIYVLVSICIAKTKIDYRVVTLE